MADVDRSNERSVDAKMPEDGPLDDQLGIQEPSRSSSANYGVKDTGSGSSPFPLHNYSNKAAVATSPLLSFTSSVEKRPPGVVAETSPCIIPRYNLALYEVTVKQEYRIPTLKTVYVDVDVPIYLPRFVEVIEKGVEEEERYSEFEAELSSEETEPSERSKESSIVEFRCRFRRPKLLC